MAQAFQQTGLHNRDEAVDNEDERPDGDGGKLPRFHPLWIHPLRKTRCTNKNFLRSTFNRATFNGGTYKTNRNLTDEQQQAALTGEEEGADASQRASEAGKQTNTSRPSGTVRRCNSRNSGPIKQARLAVAACLPTGGADEEAMLVFDGRSRRSHLPHSMATGGPLNFELLRRIAL
ncbi:hypothetical protein CCUS01_11754 [Colletotrichum cuscutae]|uniref:Uncharacterized protein n=1 Tax=Colletotrichum cuscutae TaxID=1209917 RepID=A0AAI9U122_9PEZI|nr:hypothetical protein CCUS01_11754 [Colletotrichum cuscutae]